MPAWIRPQRCICGGVAGYQVIAATGQSQGIWCDACAKKLVSDLNGSSPKAADSDDVKAAPKRPSATAKKRK